MQKNQQRANFYFLLALGLLSVFAYTILFAAIGFIRGHSLSAWPFPAALVMMGVTQYYASHEFFKINPKKVFLKTSGLLLAIMILCMAIANSVYDVSSDGQWYHQEIAYKIKNGWNPYMKEVPVPKIPGVWNPVSTWCSGPHVPPTENINGDQEVVYVKYVSINHFSKAVETMEAAIYAVTNKIETGKAINIMMLLAAFFLCMSVFHLWDRWATRKNVLISLTLTCNPIVIAQLTSFCLDGLVYAVMICLLAVFIRMVLLKNKYDFFLFGLLILLLVNLKFTSVVYTAIFCFGYVVFLVLKKNWFIFKKILLTGSISFLIGFFFIGFHPYITNFIAHGDVFEGLKETREENHAIMPSVLRDKNRFLTFFISYGTRSSEMPAADSPTLGQALKIPFSVNKKEIKNANNPELNVAGFGPFFSGAFIVSLILLAIMLGRNLKEDEMKTGMIILGAVLLSIFIVPDPWWARFVPQIWFVPCLVLVLSEIVPVKIRFIKPLLYISLWANILWAASGALVNVMIASHINYQIAQIKAQKKTIKVEYCGYLDNHSNAYRFEENNIPFVEEYVTGAHIYNVVHSTTRFETAEELPDLPEPFLMRLGRKLGGGKDD